MTNEKELLEKLSTLEHEQWVSWAQEILKKECISDETKTRWEKYFIPYSDLSESIKNQDRFFAEKALTLFKEYLKKHDQ